ncbi:DUF4197 domain-containing protein [Lacibacter sp. H407]|uniref:DUF4197 domain-containing protein n=1 Tax=Lacibacter sp. H407 TaxID=3133423 RepID=UPI0030BD22A6
MIKRYLLILSVTLFFTSCEVLSQLPNAMGTGVTEAEAGQGIKEALGQGLTRAVSNLNKTDAFFGNAFYKILLPPEVQKVERTLRNIGLGQTVDKAILQINRGAEDAVGFATPIFVNAIKQMSISDAINIIRGPKDGATNFFREKTSAALIAAFSPSVKASLDKVEATKYYGDLVNGYNRLPTTRNKLNPDLTAYVVGKTVDALFDQIAKEELEIRENPVKRTTEILKKVFGATWN